MKKEMTCFLVCMLLTITVSPVTGTINTVHTKLQKQGQKSVIVKTSIINTNNTNVDWWPMSRHDPSHSGSTTSVAPITNNIIWSFIVHVPTTSPVIVGEKVYLGTCSVGSNKENIVCLDAASGKKIWGDYPGGNVIYTPAVADGKVYFSNSMYNFFCYDAETGEEIWRKKTDYVTGAPTIVDHRVFIPTTLGVVYCFDAGTGDTIWESNTSNNKLGTAAFYEEKLYLNNMCLDATNGTVLWDYPFESCYDISNPAVAYGNVYLGTSVQCWQSSSVYCLDAKTGQEKWSYLVKDNCIWEPAAIYEGKVYFGTSSAQAMFGIPSYVHVLCFDAETGEEIWRYTKYIVGFGIPSIADGKVIIYDSEKNVHCFNADTGEKLWGYSLEELPVANQHPVIADGKLFMNTYEIREGPSEEYEVGGLYAFEDGLGIAKITGGFGITAEIINTGEDAIVDIKCTISVQGGVFGKINVSSERTIQTLSSGEIKKVRGRPFVGFGEVNIIVTVEAADANVAIKTMKGVVYIFYLKMTSS